jgi:hypothetical protein
MRLMVVVSSWLKIGYRRLRSDPGRVLISLRFLQIAFMLSTVGIVPITRISDAATCRHLLT